MYNIVLKACKNTNRLTLLLDEIKTKYKFYLLYFICVMVPLLIADTLIVYSAYSHERSLIEMEMENTANTVISFFNSEMETATAFAADIYKNSYMQDYIACEYESPLDYVIKYQEFKERTLLSASINAGGYPYTIYVDNPTIINGGFFQNIVKAQNESWYRQYIYSKQSPFLYFEFSPGQNSYYASKRKFLLLRNMDYYHQNRSRKILKIEINYSQMYEKMLNMHFDFPVYVLSNGNEILSNTEESHPNSPYRLFNIAKENCYIKYFSVFDLTLNVCVKNVSLSFGSILKKHPGFFCTLALLNVVIFIMIAMFLLQSVFKSRIKEQEMIVARQNAELLALRGQINPHFLFNMLESIRMHLVIKNENETADMIKSLAHIQRQYVDWGVDNVTVEKELECAKAYLELQKYRFGDRLNYSIEVDEGCKEILIPKLSIVTFVENSCVHGIENKSSHCWIFVRVEKQNGTLEIEVEDTGAGMSMEKKNELIKRINNASMELLQEKGRVGVVNTCLRLKIATDNKVKFRIESEEMEGTVFTIRIPLKND